MGETGCDIRGKWGCVGEYKKKTEKKNEKIELISDMWGKRVATYGEKGVCRRIQNKPEAESRT